MLVKKSLSEQIVEDIVQKVASREFLPGQKLTIAQLQELYQVSSSPVRDALISLTHMGFVTASSNSSYRIPLLSDEEKQQKINLYDYTHDLTVRILWETGDLEHFAQVFEQTCNAFLQSGGLPPARQMRLYADLNNVALENCGNPFWEYSLEVHQGTVISAFGDYTQCLTLEEARDNAQRMMEAVRRRDQELFTRESKFFIQCLHRTLERERAQQQ